MSDQTADEELLQRLNDELLRLNRQRQAVPTGSELEAASLRVLWALHRYGPRTLRELCADLNLEQSTINRQVNRAIERGLIERYAVAGSTSRYLRPTEAGAQAYRRDSALRNAIHQRALSDLGDERLRRLIDDLGMLNDALERNSPD